LFFESGGFQIGESRGEDLDLWAKIALKHPIAFSSEIGAIIHEEATNRGCDSQQSMEEPLWVKNAKNALADGKVPERMLPYFNYLNDRWNEFITYPSFNLLMVVNDI